MRTTNQYPKEFFVPLDGEPDFFGRLTVLPTLKGFCVEVDIVTRESQKIFKHIDTLFQLEEERDAVNSGMSRLAGYLGSISGQGVR